MNECKSDQPRIENSPDAVSLTDMNDERLDLSRTFGYQLEELVGPNSFKLIHPDHLYRAHKSAPIGCKVRHKDGNDTCAESTVAILLTASDVQAILMHQQDIITAKGADANRHREAATKRGGWSSGRLK
jgi:PAS domain S-box-containing protein